jgi:hypothetical protein
MIMAVYAVTGASGHVGSCAVQLLAGQRGHAAATAAVVA